MKLPEILDKIKDILVLLCIEDKEALYRYAQNVSDNGIIVDIGTAAGGSALIMAMASKPTVRVFTIDPAHNENFVENINKFNLSDKIEYLNFTSIKSFDNWNLEIDLLFIDGVHNYDGVKSDFETFGSKVKKGGVVAFHDIFLHDDIGKYTEELMNLRKLRRLETVDDLWTDNQRIGMFIGEKL